MEGAIVEVLLDELAHWEGLGYFGSIMDVDLKKWHAKLSLIQVVLKDAEERQLEDNLVKLWLDDLRDLAYDVQNILAKYDIEMLKRKIQAQASTSTKVRRSLSKGIFNFKMSSEIKEITDRLQDISLQKNIFNLKETRMLPKARPMTTSLIGPYQGFIGRENDTRQIVEFLSKQEPFTINFDVVAIFGMAGVGKTALAAQVYNDSAAEEFSPKVWVCVSDDFSLVRVAQAILESLTSRHCELKELNNVLESISKELAGKKFLIVLDDVWETCDYVSWTTLQSSFLVGAPGSKIILTTRHEGVAKMVGATKVHNLERISNDHCWEVFKRHALLNINNDIPQNFESVKEKIIAKCQGLPLAAKTLGGLLRCKRMDEWEEILNNKLWSLSDESDILPVLKLSYHYLSSNLKQCFAYCSLLPNDYEFKEKQLILLWMAEGLIQKTTYEEMLKLGGDYFQELISRSLFQKSSKCNSRYVMNNLVVELARWVAGEFCFRLEDKRVHDRQHRRARHSSYICGWFDGVKKFEAFSQIKHLRTFLPLSLSDSSSNYLAHNITFDLLPKFQYLWVLSLNGYQIKELPNSIGKLKYLRYLDLSYTPITSLPESTCTLYNLQTLILEGCSYLKALPRNMRNLINLRHLNNSNVSSLEGMPPNLGKLTDLQSLPNFVVGKACDSGLREIGSLLHLRETLYISRLENVIDVEDARKANLISLEGLDELLLKWSYSSDTREMESVLEMLKPHSKLKELTVSGYGGLNFSTWIGDPLFSKMVLVSLENCYSCRFLPSLGQLPSLKKLHIKGMTSVEIVGLEFYGNGCFPVLETLEFEDMKHWKKWFPCLEDERIGVFPCLKMLSIKECPKLWGRLPENLGSLIEKLEIVNCKELVVSLTNYKQLLELYIQNCKRVVGKGVVDFELLEFIHLSNISELVVSLANYKKLQELNVSNCKGFVHTRAVDFVSLESIHLSNISELRLQTEDFMKGFTKVKDLKITGCEKLTSSWKNEDRLLQLLISLHRLDIEGNSSLVQRIGKEAEELQIPCKLEHLKLKDCESLSNLPEGLHHLMSLQELEIYGCSSLVSFPDVGLPPSIKFIKIEGCNSLMYFARHEISPSLRRIEVQRCKNLKSLLEEEEGDGSSSSSYHFLEYLKIVDCPSLTSLSFKGQIPRALKHLVILNCKQLEFITDWFSHDNTCLEYIKIQSCRNLISLPQGLYHLTNLQTLLIDWCGSLVSFPEFPSTASKLRQISITNCGKLRRLPDMHNLNSLKELVIDYCDGVTSFPPNLISLHIWKLRSCKPLWELKRGLQELTSLKDLLLIDGEDPGLLSFPPEEMRLPESLVKLEIEGFPNLRHLSNNLVRDSRGSQILNSLESLAVYNCLKLEYIPEDGLPRSLTKLYISKCPLLQKKCETGKGRYWPSIAHIPCIKIRY